jgi:uncharacterized Zn-finger protein
MDQMNENDIRTRYQELSKELRNALSTMERTDRVFIIRDEIKELQNMCPHSNGNYDFSDQDACPYCGKKFRK